MAVQASPDVKPVGFQTEPVVIIQDHLTINEGTGDQQKIHIDALSMVPQIAAHIKLPRWACKESKERAVSIPRKRVTSKEAKLRKNLKCRILRRISPSGG